MPDFIGIYDWLKKHGVEEGTAVLFMLIAGLTYLQILENDQMKRKISSVESNFNQEIRRIEESYKKRDRLLTNRTVDAAEYLNTVVVDIKREMAGERFSADGVPLQIQRLINLRDYLARAGHEKPHENDRQTASVPKVDEEVIELKKLEQTPEK